MYTYFIWKTKPNILFYCYFRFTISFSKWIKIMLCCISDLSLDFLWEWRRVVYCPVIKMKGNKLVCIAVIKWQSDDRAMKKVHCIALHCGVGCVLSQCNGGDDDVICEQMWCLSFQIKIYPPRNQDYPSASPSSTSVQSKVGHSLSVNMLINLLILPNRKMRLKKLGMRYDGSFVMISSRLLTEHFIQLSLIWSLFIGIGIVLLEFYLIIITKNPASFPT